jgi:hypothetical protein
MVMMVMCSLEPFELKLSSLAKTQKFDRYLLDSWLPG